MFRIPCLNQEPDLRSFTRQRRHVCRPSNEAITDSDSWVWNVFAVQEQVQVPTLTRRVRKNDGRVPGGGESQ